jgi:hypothetical protein
MTIPVYDGNGAAASSNGRGIAGFPKEIYS